MPEYDYRCTKCKKKFTATLTVSEKENKRVKCPKCNSVKVEQRFTPFFAKTSRKS
jgi:putative FmdB family regulatory protein